MKKFYSKMMLLTMMVAALSFAACGDDDLSNEGHSEIVGTWKVRTVEGWEDILSDEEIGDEYFEYLQFKSNGTYIRVTDDENEEKGYSIQYGQWTIKDDELHLKITSELGKGLTFTYTLEKIDKNEIVMTMWGFTVYLVRISDSTMDKYLK